MLPARDLARGQAPRAHDNLCGAAACAIGGCGAGSSLHHAQRAGNKEADREGHNPASSASRSDSRSGVRFCLPGTIFSNCMTMISGSMPREYVNRFEMKGGLYRLLRDTMAAFPFLRSAARRASKTNYASCPAAVNLALPRRLPF